jgi:hypothetical protein
MARMRSFCAFYSLGQGCASQGTKICFVEKAGSRSAEDCWENVAFIDRLSCDSNSCPSHTEPTMWGRAGAREVPEVNSDRTQNPVIGWMRAMGDFTQNPAGAF